MPVLEFAGETLTLSIVSEDSAAKCHREGEDKGQGEWWV